MAGAPRADPAPSMRRYPRGSCFAPALFRMGCRRAYDVRQSARSCVRGHKCGTTLAERNLRRDRSRRSFGKMRSKRTRPCLRCRDITTRSERASVSSTGPVLAVSRSIRKRYQGTMNLIEKGTKDVRSQPAGWRVMRGEGLLRGS